MEVKSYNSVIRQLQFLMNNDTFVKKKIQEIMKLSDIMNNTNTHVYTQAAENMFFIQICAKKGIHFFGERAIVAMIKIIQTTRRRINSREAGYCPNKY